tara:strand:- start:35 stop:655 length:621 start_codon:yes stop_codon:yes gene_type:complete
MAKKKDIGTLFEKKLKEGEKSPNNNLWEKINTSLDEQDRKRKRGFFYWFAGAGALLLIGLVIFGNNFIIPDNAASQEDIAVPKKDESELSIENHETSDLNYQQKDSILLQNSEGEKLLRITASKEDSINRTKIVSEIKSKNEPKSSSSKNKNIDETYKVSKKYYYYNSKNGKQLVTENKNTIDSLMLEATKNLDSTTTEKPDSVEH